MGCGKRNSIGDGDLSLALSAEALFERMCAWDDASYIIGASSKRGSDSNSTDGIVDGHAYSVLEVRNDVAGTSVDMVKMRNPWGRGEMASGEWDDE